ncbi:MAG: proton-conducting transporter membrane subunit [Candidatus Omnitrophica bacterium]|nr:proton-conducting transporter membrane subunit [Candidatus Omnitrophota bacterium]MDD5488897.1 proton-conducting transporter membrane subunit [Candidatus Omnitrophota bacterium]
MDTILCSLYILLLSGVLSLALNRHVKLSNIVGSSGVVLSSIAGIIALLIAYRNGGPAAPAMPWKVPFGSFSIAIDSLGSLFLFPIFILAALSALYGSEYLKHYFGKKNIGSTWLFFNSLVAGMVLVVLARNAVLFLVAWELMSVSSFFLVIFEGEKKNTARAGLTYLIATHIGTLFLMVMFILLAKNSGSFDFAAWTMPAKGTMLSIIFICALVGFGTKAGLMPLHIWLPEAHPAAPSHVSAIMSGVMIKTGIYGILRVLTFLGTPCAWWGYTLIAIGAVSGILGILFALAQHDIKRLLAYSSIENIGLISIGIGMGILGMAANDPVLTFLGFAGALWHVVNHSFFKGLLFLGAGAIAHRTGTREINVLGGLLKKMPLTGSCFLVGSAAICGLPPLNGFIGEFLLYFASLKSIFGETGIVLVSLGIIASLSLIGGLALACFTKAFGMIFLGEPRSPRHREARDPNVLMLAPMMALAGACIFMGLGAPFIMGAMDKIIINVAGTSTGIIGMTASEAARPLAGIAGIFTLFYAIILSAALFRRGLLAKRDVRDVVTWDCGYAQPEPRMQYTASSFVQPIMNFFKGILRTEKDPPKTSEFFPDSSSFRTETADIFSEVVFRPLLEFIHRMAEKLTLVQHGQMQFYILYILFALVMLFIWKL